MFSTVKLLNTTCLTSAPARSNLAVVSNSQFCPGKIGIITLGFSTTSLDIGTSASFNGVSKVSFPSSTIIG